MQNERRIIIFIFLFALSLRLVLCFLNRAANDDHVDVVSWIADKQELPGKNDCWSCYQPKLYYLVCAGFVKLFGVEKTADRIFVMQLVNLILSFFILLLTLKFINKQPLSARNKIFTVAFFAFNPCLIGINAQGTNDTPVIFCGVLAVYAAESFFKEMKLYTAIILTVALIAGALVKASAFVLFGAISFTFIFKILCDNRQSLKRKTAKYFLLLIIPYLLIVPFAGGYYSNYKQFDSLTLSTWNPDPPPRFFKTTPSEKRPGLRNMLEGFFTFRYFDMIRQPYINNDWSGYPLHRTSLWSQLYGRTLFLHFDQWPRPWQSHDKLMVTNGRILVILGIVPLTLVLIGLINSLDFVRNLIKRNQAYLASPENYLHLLIMIALLSSSMFYTYHYRDFSSMKSIYLFPGMLSFVKFFSDGLSSLKSPILISLTQSVLFLMTLLSILDVVFLIYQLQ